MQNDAKLGLLAGLAATLAVAVVYFQKPVPPAGPAPKTAVAGVGNAPPSVPPAAVKVPTRPAAATRPWDED